jgi:beta-lactamase regulating signal transducer with metallopeptidase domain
VVHWAAARIRLERELACDQVAMHESSRGPAEYAQTLVRVLGAGSDRSVFRTSATTPLDG